ncbi:flagellar filament capping protein FliD [Lacrimispora sp.]|uniref:flagellar filament capping protein FliD n=1 Tax=Lacrimispora sp. TaxID=2719234 RepID=UPI00345F72C8
MASVYNSVTNSSYSSSIQGFGGLASGLDRDSLIEGMTAATRAKIAKQQKSKQTLLWKQDAYRSISSKLIEFSKKYTSYTSPATNISSSTFWAKSSVTAVGANSKYISVTGSPTTSSAVSVVGVKQLATTASAVSTNNVSNQRLETGPIDFSDRAVNNLEGQTLTFQLGNKTFNVRMGSGDYSTGEGVEKALNEALARVSVGNEKLSAYVQASVTETVPGGKTSVVSSIDGEVKPDYKLNFNAVGEGTANGIRLVGGSKQALNALGIDDEGIEKLKDDKSDYGVINEDGIKDLDINDQKLYSSASFADIINEKSMSFTYNGVTKSIKLAYDGTVDDKLGTMAVDIQKKLNKEFGTGRIEVIVEGIDDDKKLVFKTTDSSSDLSIASADAGVIGKNGALSVEAGTSNRLNMGAVIGEAGLVNTIASGTTIKINEYELEIDETSTLSDIIKKINESDAGVTITYMKTADRFSIVSKQEGGSGNFEINDVGAELFGIDKEKIKKGQDAIISVKYGEYADPINIERGSNTFNLDGLAVTVNGTFGTYVDDTVTYNSADAVTFNAQTDSDKIVKAVSDMIKDYNEIVKLVNDELTTKPNRKYEPLTDEQKEDMSESQIEKWEKEAKTGMLFGDSILRSLSDSLRSVFQVDGADAALLTSIGITKSTSYSDNGALVFDETKFRAGLETSEDKIQELFTRKADTGTGTREGLAGRLTAVTNQYASTTGAIKGSLIEKAGSTYAPTSILSNALKKSMDEVDKFVERLQAQLQVETDRYVKQFTSLETVISQMNSQSSWLQGAFGG